MGYGQEDNSDLGKLKRWLREEFRMKDGTDYAVVRRFSETHFLAKEIWVEYLREGAEKFNISITSVSIIG